MSPVDIERTARDVLAFWFGELTPKQWWNTDASIDAACAARFGDLHAALAEQVDPAWLETPEAALAAVIALDQFSRNIHRGRAQAFAQDAEARAVADAAIARGHDVALPSERRHFLYMPFMHAEDAAGQARSLQLFATLGPGALEHAARHKAVFDRFGRFPKRNAALGRDCTAEERAYLRESVTGAV